MHPCIGLSLLSGPLPGAWEEASTSKEPSLRSRLWAAQPFTHISRLLHTPVLWSKLRNR